jgi:predicted ribonuclease YlaK
VLVTDDINLRVKAHGRRVPVRGLEAFAKVIQMPVRG